jgi:hypothetical protein
MFACEDSSFLGCGIEPLGDWLFHISKDCSVVFMLKQSVLFDTEYDGTTHQLYSFTSQKICILTNTEVLHVSTHLYMNFVLELQMSEYYIYLYYICMRSQIIFSANF